MERCSIRPLGKKHLYAKNRINMNGYALGGVEKEIIRYGAVTGVKSERKRLKVLQN